MLENQQYDKKSLFLKGKNTDWDELAKDAICFENSSGGKIFIAIEHNIIKDKLLKIWYFYNN